MFESDYIFLVECVNAHRFMMALAERSNDDQTAKIQSVVEDLRRVELEVGRLFVSQVKC